jgi:two-component system, response regulator PdtaR
LQTTTRHMDYFPFRPQPVFTREGSAGSDKVPELGARILIVEDNFLVASQVEKALSDAGFDVTGVATSAEEAVALAHSGNPALIVMDVRLAGERDGIQAAVDIFQGLGMRCIFATAHYDQMTRDRAKPAKPLGWLEKPYSMASLVDTVRHALKELNGQC